MEPGATSFEWSELGISRDGEAQIVSRMLLHSRRSRRRFMQLMPAINRIRIFFGNDFFDLPLWAAGQADLSMT